MMDVKIISDALHMADSMLDVSPADWPRLRAETKKIIARAKEEIAALSSPHPEAREEDIEAAFNSWASQHVSYGTPGSLVRSVFKAGYDAALSLLAALREPDGRKGE